LASLIEEYTARDLTLFKDRLPVLAGIASELGLYVGHGDLGGLWGEFLILKLGRYRGGDIFLEHRRTVFDKKCLRDRIGAPS
jgi:hypothetical protein